MAIGIQVSAREAMSAKASSHPSPAKVRRIEVGCWELAEKAPLQVVPPSTELFRQGDEAKAVYLLEEGFVKRLRLEEQGQQMIMGLRLPGQLLGAAPALLEKRYTVTAQTVTRCEVRYIPAATFRRESKTNPKVASWVNRVLSSQIYSQDAQLAGLGVLSARQRLEQFLWELASVASPGRIRHDVRLQVPLKQSEIAQLIAVTESYLCKLLKQMERDGVIRRSKGWLIVPDPRRFRH